ncbi:MAG: hypothetical protein M3380_07925, partial [Chloroflexota bacterium]|nr:hypothetical protein [Chloroflexota bacterium]
MLYGQVKKTSRRRKVVRVTRVMRCGTVEDLRASLHTLGLSGRLNTAFVERMNLMLRQGVAALARRTWATAPAAPALLAHLEWWRSYYHLVRLHAALRVPLAQPIERGGRRIPPPLSAANAGDGSRADKSTVDGARVAARAPATSPRWCGLTRTRTEPRRLYPRSQGAREGEPFTCEADREANSAENRRRS